MPFEIFLELVEAMKVKITLKGHINWLVRAINPTVMHEFQNNLAHLFSLRSSSAI